ncbi:MAG: 2-amino-4-hydroxy-6-hydroxymethyldihydropteridine diphosphokinase [Bacteroidota bacterium]|nr:2-amino-4-hydroxy-6-hydroxymethyldihydropteridine diphosphokinase [Bacteroidota bacterium]
MSLAYLGLGTNLGNKAQNLHNAVTALQDETGRVLGVSSYYTSKPWGFKSENMFLNAVVLVETSLQPLDLLAKTQEIERKLGRTSKSADGYSDRVIDIDILMYDNRIIDLPDLKIPHPLLATRDFVLIPFAELAPDLIHPLSGKSLIELRDELIS